MRDGVTRSSVSYVWPRTIVRPPRPPKLVYLDLNHWIALTKATNSHPDGRVHQSAWEACLDAARQGRARFPIADSTYMEIAQIGQYRQRHDLRVVIEELSSYYVVMARHLVSRHEIEALLDDKSGVSLDRVNEMPYLSWGVTRAFGINGGFRVRSADGADVTESARQSYRDGPESWDAIIAAADLELQRRSIEGPTAVEEPEMRSLGWRPYAAQDVTRQRLQQELEQVTRFDTHPQWRRGRLRDVISGREMLIEINEHLYEAVNARGLDLDALFETPRHTRELMDAMPSFDVAVTLKTAYHRDPGHRWTENDIHDIDALGSTVPYCDVVVTDKAAAHQLTVAGVAERCETVVLSRLRDLVDHL